MKQQRHNRLDLLARLGLCTLLAACSTASGDGTPGDGDGDGDGNGDGDGDSGETCDKIDYLFVIDDSGSMQAEQENLAANLPMFADVIANYAPSGVAVDYRVAVTSTGSDVVYEQETFASGQTIRFDQAGANGAFFTSCGMSRPWLEAGDADLAGTFACAAELGTGGPGAEMPLLALDWALTRRVDDGQNAGFARDDALLAVIILTDQDDCSREDDNFVLAPGARTCFDPSDSNIIDLDHYLTTIDDFKGDRGRWALATIAGPGPDDCSSDFGGAAEATRLIDFVDRVGDNAVISSICEEDLSTALADALSVFDDACRKFPPIE